MRGIPRLLRGSFRGGAELKVNKTVSTSCDNIMTLHEALRLEFLVKQRQNLNS